MAKTSIAYVCNDCGGVSAKWNGKCPHCGQWNTLTETRVDTAPGNKATANRRAAWSGTASAVRDLKAVRGSNVPRIATGLDEFDRVLGGGLVKGSITLLGGDPGIGKSTLLLQTAAAMGSSHKCVYITGEESAEQIALRAERLGLAEASVRLAAEIDVEGILAILEAEKPELAIIDSIQTVYHPQLQSAPGSVAQVRECAAQLTRYAKTSGCSIILIGHVTKEGSIAGPRVLEHMVDAALFFEGENGTSFRMLRAIKNRFGAVNEMGVFSMGGRGLEEVANPSGLFLSRHEQPVLGCCILATMEGNRPLLVEVQALVEDSPSPNPRRYASGLDLNRLQMILAILNKFGGKHAFDQNVYLKVVGGVRITEPAADLAVLLALHSSMSLQPLPDGLVVFGEVGLAGELRPVNDILARLKEAAKLGYKLALAPQGGDFPKTVDGLRVVTASRVESALGAVKRERKAA